MSITLFERYQAPSHYDQHLKQQNYQPRQERGIYNTGYDGKIFTQYEHALLNHCLFFDTADFMLIDSYGSGPGRGRGGRGRGRGQSWGRGGYGSYQGICTLLFVLFF